MAVLADEHELANRAYDLAMGLRKQFGDTVPAWLAEQQWRHDAGLSPAEAAQQQWINEQEYHRQWANQQHAQQALYMRAAYGLPPPPPPPTPLDAAINDVDVSIYEVIRLAEETVHD